MEYEKPIILVQQIIQNSTFWLMFGITFFNITWMKFERNVRIERGNDSQWPNKNDLDMALPLLNYAIHFYGLFIGWLLYMIDLSTLVLPIVNGHPPSLTKLLCFIWLVLTLVIGLTLFLGGTFGSLKLVRSFQSKKLRDRILNRLFISRSILLMIVFVTICIEVYFL